ncbi:MAG TPA: ribbon-helix-helix protein, CopG family [Methanothermobacter sp.]|nr:ribbon-helix-helix protein, CopG family [Methanothermobacter sp.]
MKKDKRITIKITKKQYNGLKQLAKKKGDQPLSFVVREAIQEYINKYQE